MRLKQQNEKTWLSSKSLCHQPEKSSPKLTRKKIPVINLYDKWQSNMNLSVLCFEMKAQSSERTKDSNFYFISPSIKLNKWLEKGHRQTMREI
jgi:hypothetical protein